MKQHLLVYMLIIHLANHPLLFCQSFRLGLPSRLKRVGSNMRDGNYCALAVTELLRLEDSGGMLRVGPVHYNTVEEIKRFGEELGRITSGVT